LKGSLKDYEPDLLRRRSLSVRYEKKAEAIRTLPSTATLCRQACSVAAAAGAS
jgi:hypothetical protein